MCWWYLIPLLGLAFHIYPTWKILGGKLQKKDQIKFFGERPLTVVKPDFTRLLQQVPNAARNTSTQQTLLLAFAGFAFAGLVAIVVAIPASTRYDLHFPIYYCFISMLAYLFALSIESYKLKRVIEIISEIIQSVAIVSLVASALSLILAFQPTLGMPLTIIAIIVGGIDLSSHALAFYDIYRDSKSSAMTKKQDPQSISPQAKGGVSE